MNSIMWETKTFKLFSKGGETCSSLIKAKKCYNQFGEGLIMIYKSFTEVFQYFLNTLVCIVYVTANIKNNKTANLVICDRNFWQRTYNNWILATINEYSEWHCPISSALQVTLQPDKLP